MKILFKFVIALLFLIYFSSSYSKSVFKKPGEDDITFAKRQICETCEIHEGIDNHPGVMRIKFPIKDTILVFFNHDFDQENSKINTDNYNNIHDETDVSMIFLIPEKQSGSYFKILVSSLEVNGGPPAVSSVFYANADRDDNRELFVLVQWDIKHADIRGTIYGTKAFDSSFLQESLTYEIKELPEFIERFHGFEGYTEVNKSNAKYKTASDVKKAIRQDTSKRTFAHTWEWTDGGDLSSFEVIIEERDGFFIGRYCAVAQSGRKIDCPFSDEEQSFKFKNTGDMKYEFNFVSSYSGTVGRARLESSEGKMVWEITKQPKDEYYAPLKAVLVKP